MHTRGWVVVWERGLVPEVALLEGCSAKRGSTCAWHVFGCVEALIPGPINSSAESAGVVIVEPCTTILKMQDQPEFETRVGYSKPNPVLASLLDRIFETRMVPWPLNIEDTPEFIDLTLLIYGSGRASIAMDTSVRGTDPPRPVSTRRSTAAMSRTRGCLFRALRYSGSVLSPSQKTRSVFRGLRVATLRLSCRPR